MPFILYNQFKNGYSDLGESPIRKRPGELSTSLPMGCTWATEWVARWAAHGNFAMQIRLTTTSIYRNSGQLSGQLSRQPTASKIWKKWAAEWAAHGNFAMQMRLPLLIYNETVGSSVGSPLLPNMKKLAAQWAVEWAAHGLPIGILPCKLGCPLKHIYRQWAAQWATQWAAHYFKYGNSGQFSGQPTDLRTTKFIMEAIFDLHARYL